VEGSDSGTIGGDIIVSAKRDKQKQKTNMGHRSRSSGRSLKHGPRRLIRQTLQLHKKNVELKFCLRQRLHHYVGHG
jgi:hypothetical protein